MKKRLCYVYIENNGVSDTTLCHQPTIPYIHQSAIEFANGTKYWYVNDKRHREDGPAVEYANGGKEWYIDGKRHRLDGPAIEYANGYKAWYIDNKELTKEEFNIHPKHQNYLFDIEVRRMLSE
jgi:hypothetical protein